MRLIRYIAIASTLAFWSALSAPASAQSREALAEALYTSALDLMEEGKNEEACPKLKQSQEIDPAVGTLLYLGLCYERLGKTASAWAAYRAAGDASRKAKQPERRDIALQRAAKLEPTLSTLTIELPLQARPADLQLLLDGAPVGVASIGVPMPVDPGPHRVEATGAGYDTVTENVQIQPGGMTHSVNLPALRPSAAPEAPGAAPPPTAGAPASSASPSSSPSPAPVRDRGADSSGDTQRTFGLAMGGVGLVGLAAGTYFGLDSRSKENDAKNNCTNYPNGCNSAGIAANEDAQDAAGYATASFLIGGAALLGGIIVYATAPSSEPASDMAVQAVPLPGRGGALGVSGRW